MNAPAETVERPTRGADLASQAVESVGREMALQTVNQAGAVVPPASNSGSLLEAITAAAANPAVDMDKMERLYKMHTDMVAKEAEAAFNAALARAQAKVVPIATNATNKHTESRYARLDAVCKMITPIFSAEGLSISFNTGKADDPKQIRVIGLLSHAAGHTRQYHIDLDPDLAGAKGNTNKTPVQGTGSTNSYGRRYLQFMMANLSTFDDNDGNKDDGPGAGKMPEQQFADFDAKVDEVTDAAALAALWKQIVQICNELKPKDWDAYHHFKKRIETRGAQIKPKGKSK